MSITTSREERQAAETMGNPFMRLREMWHEAFGAVKCWATDCHVCATTDWPDASWVRRREQPCQGGLS